MRSVEDTTKSVNKNEDDDEKEKQQNIPEKVTKVAGETRRLLPNPSLLYERRSKDVDEWLDEMKFYAWKSRGIPESRRKELWLTLAEKYFHSKCINWEERRNTSMYVEDRDMEDQIIKDLHRTGSAFCSGPNSIINQGKLKHLLLEYAQWNPKVGYCQGFNVLGAFILQIMEKEQENSLKIMVYLLEGLLPPGYYSESLVGLQIDMAVFRQLMFEHLPKLATHLQNLESGQGYDEPPLTNLFTMQWFLTIFCTCLAMPSLLRIWDLIFLEGNEVIFRTALAIWSVMEKYVTKMNSIDDFYGNMGILFQRLCIGNMCDPAELVKIVSRFKPISNLHVLRVKHKQHSERNKRPNKERNQRNNSLPSSSQSTDPNQKLIRSDSIKKVNIKNIDMSVFKKQYEKLKRRPSLELNAVTLGKKAFDGKTAPSFSVNKFWSNTNNNNIKNTNNGNNRKLLKSNENKKEHLININKHNKKIENNLIPHHRHMKSKKSPDIKQFPKPEKLDSLINNKDDIIQSSDSSSTTSLCDNDDYDDDSLYECRSLSHYYSDSIDETCDNWPNIEIKNSDKEVSENVNLILEQIASYSTSNNSSNIISETDNVADKNVDKDDNQQLLLQLEVTKLPDTDNIITCDENNYDTNYKTNQKDEIIVEKEKEIDKKFDFQEIEKWRKKYLKTPSEKNLDNPSLENEEIKSANINENILNIDLDDSKILESSVKNDTSSLLDCKNCTDNENVNDNYTQLNTFENETPDFDKKVKHSISSEKISSSFLSESLKCEISNKEIKLDTQTPNNTKDIQQDNSNIVEEGVTNEVFDNLFQNKFSQFAKYAVKDYLEGIHYTKNGVKEDGEVRTETRTYYDVFKIIEENSKVLDSLSKKSNNIIISPAESSDNIQQESGKSDEKLTSSPIKDEDLNESFSDVKTVKDNQIDLTAADEISSSECNSISLQADGVDILYEKANIELKIDTVENEIETNSLRVTKTELETKGKFNNEFDNDLLSGNKYYSGNRMSRSFEEKVEHKIESKFDKENSKSLQNLELKDDSLKKLKNLDSGEKQDEDTENIEVTDKNIGRFNDNGYKNDENNYIHDKIVKKDDYSEEILKESNNDNPFQFLDKRENLLKEDKSKILNGNDLEAEKKIFDYESYEKESYQSFDKGEDLLQENKSKLLNGNDLGTEKKIFDYVDYEKANDTSDNFETFDQNKTTKNVHDDENDYESKRLKKIQSKDSEEKYDQYWFIEKSEQIEKRRDSLRKSVSPIESLKDPSTYDSKDSLYDSSSKSSKEIDSSYKFDKTEDLLSKIRLTNLDELEYKERKSSLTRPLSMTNSEKIIYPSTKTVRILESPIENVNKKFNNKYDEYKKETTYDDFDNDYNNKISTIKSIDANIILNRYGIKIENDIEDDLNISKIRVRSSYDSQTYDRKYFSRKDESDFKERLESIKNTIKFIDDLCDENDKVNRRKRCYHDATVRKSLIFDELLSKTPTTTTQENENRFKKVITFNSSEQCSNTNSNNKYNDNDDNDLFATTYSSTNTPIIGKNSIYKRNSSYENLNVQNENQNTDNLYSSTYENKVYDDTKENVDFESIEKRKSKSYSNIYFSKIE